MAQNLFPHFFDSHHLTALSRPTGYPPGRPGRRKSPGLGFKSCLSAAVISLNSYDLQPLASVWAAQNGHMQHTPWVV